jgi:DNA topoisomerase-1
MEDDLDLIAQGGEEVLPWLTRFYFGETDGASRQRTKTARAGARGGSKRTSPHTSGRSTRGRSTRSRSAKGSDGEEFVLRVGRYGPYLQRGEDRASVPEDLAPDELTVERAEELLAAPSGDRVVGKDPATGLDVIVKCGSLRTLCAARRSERRGTADDIFFVLDDDP